MSQPTSDDLENVELRIDIRKLANAAYGEDVYITDSPMWLEFETKLLQLIKQRDAAIRIDEVKQSYNNELPRKMNERIAQLRRESDQAKEEKQNG